MHPATVGRSARLQSVYDGWHGLLWVLASGELLFINQSLALDARITVLTRAPEAFLRKCPHLAGNPSLTLVRGDVVNLSAAGERYDFVIHAATEASAKQASERPLEMLSTIVEGTRRTLEFARQCGARKFLLTSSGQSRRSATGDNSPLRRLPRSAGLPRSPLGLRRRQAHCRDDVYSLFS